jgi:protein TonB
MMRSWLYKNAKAVLATSAAISVITHATVITGWVVGTLPEPGMPASGIANKVFYIPPPDRVPAAAGSREQVHYIKLDVNGFGTGEGPREAGNDRPTSNDETVGHEMPAPKDSVSADATIDVPSRDSVFSVLEVDTAVVRSASSAAPSYPASLLAAHIQGFVNAQYVVDTSGRADTATFHVMESTNPEFVSAVKDVLPLMRFQPAKIGSVKVRQLVQQQFSFKIAGDSLFAIPPKKRP